MAMVAMPAFAAPHGGHSGGGFARGEGAQHFSGRGFSGGRGLIGHGSYGGFGLGFGVGVYAWYAYPYGYAYVDPYYYDPYYAARPIMRAGPDAIFLSLS